MLWNLKKPPTTSGSSPSGHIFSHAQHFAVDVSSTPHPIFAPVEACTTTTLPAVSAAVYPMLMGKSPTALPLAVVKLGTKTGKEYGAWG